MLRRKAYDKLVEWKNKSDKQSLIVDGARQVGKTFIIREFAKTNYKNFIELNFLKNSNYKEIFEGSLAGEDIIDSLKQKFTETNFEENETLIFLDEIQECPNAITALKFLTEYGKYDVIASGSLLGIMCKYASSFPVGYVDHLTMHSLDFEEFLWALGIKDENIKIIKKYFDEKKEVPTSIHSDMIEKFKKYIIVGGMPQVVNLYVETKDIQVARNKQKTILIDYKYDIAKYADNLDKMKITACFESIPRHLSKDYKKFMYSEVNKGANSRSYGGCLEWLKNANIINYCYNLKLPEIPLDTNTRQDTFKIYMADTGLLMAMLEDESVSRVLNGELGIYKGALYENVIGDLLAKKEKKLYYFEYNSTLEVDFITIIENTLTAIEVKSADNTKSKSLKSIMENWGVEKGIKLSSKNIGVSNNVSSYPLYMIMFL